MATLYELTNEFMELLLMAEDPDVDEQTLADTLEAIGGEIEDKADGYAMVMRQMQADADGIKSEIDRLNSRKQAITRNIDRMKRNLQAAMEVTDKRKFKTTLFTFSIQRNPAAVVIDEQYIENIPDKYLIPQEPKIDRKAIAADLKAGDETAKGIAHLEQSEGLRIK